MERHTPLAESPDKPNAQKPFFRSEDFDYALIIAGLTAAALFFGALIVCSVLLKGGDRFPSRLFLCVALVPSVAIWVSSYLFVRRKYSLAWSEIGLTFRHWQRALIWAAALFPVTLLFWSMEEWGWRRLLYQYPIPILTPWQSPFESYFLGIKDADITRFEVTIFVILTVISQGTFFWGLVYNGVERESSSVICGIFCTAFLFQLIYSLGLLFVVSLPFASACIITFAYQRTRTLLTPVILTAGGILFSLYVVQPTDWYALNRYTIRGICVCSVDGAALDNGIVTQDGREYQNLTVVKWNAGTQGGKGETTTSETGAFEFEKAAPRGYNAVLTVTSTHYHSHGTGGQLRLKKCVYTHTVPLVSPEDAIEIVEKDFALIPKTAAELH